MKFLINKIYGYLVNLSKIFSRKNLNNFIYKRLSNEKKLNKVLLIGSTGRFNDLLIKISKEKSLGRDVLNNPYLHFHTMDYLHISDSSFASKSEFYEFLEKKIKKECKELKYLDFFNISINNSYQELISDSYIDIIN